jgi:hypothetical protein
MPKINSFIIQTELDILNLIRMQGNALTLEIFRRPSRQGSTKSKVLSPKFFPPARISTLETSTDEENSIKPAPPLKLSSANMSNVSLERTKRRLRLPQVAPAHSSKEVVSKLHNLIICTPSMFFLLLRSHYRSLNKIRRAYESAT